MSRRTPIALAVSLVVVAAPARAEATATGGTTYRAPHSGSAAQAPQTTPAPAPPATPATVGPGGLAVAPAGAPPAVAALIAAGNAIASLPYRYGGGHRSFTDTAYDCSGSVSFALHGAGLLDWTLDSTGLGRWGEAGPGTWVTVYANKAHTYLVVAGLRFDTSGRAKGGSRWQAAARSAAGFRVRHPTGL
jgi:hypothetical protein